MGRWHDLSLCRLPILQEILVFRYYLISMLFLLSNVFLYSSFSFTTTMHSSTIRICNSQLRPLLVFSSWVPTLSTTSIESRYLDATFSTSMFKWELMSWLRRENIYSEGKKWRNGSGSQLIFKKHSWDATDSHSKMTLQTSQTLNFSFKISSEDTLTILLRSHSPSETLESEHEETMGSKEI